MKVREGKLYLFDEVPYLTAWRWQQLLVSQRKAPRTAPLCDSASDGVKKDVLMLLEHPPVYTLGQGADPRFLRFDPSDKAYELHRVERGGEVTYHCPGQLVGYPVLNLHRYQLDLHWYLRQLEEVLIRTLSVYGLSGERVAGMTGVWVEGRKVAAIGIKVSRWITMHGFALNICPDLKGFDKIVPCGLEGKLVGSMAQFVPDIVFEQVRQVVIQQFEQVFGLVLVKAAGSELMNV
ncbi:MAG: lipoyl(octanoyl) transferase LipB [Cyanobacteria bacterium J06560_6]